MPLSEAELNALEQQLTKEVGDQDAQLRGSAPPAPSPRQQEDLAQQAKGKLRQPVETREIAKKRKRVAGLKQRSRLDPFSQGSENTYDPSSGAEVAGELFRTAGSGAAAAINPLYRTGSALYKAGTGDFSGAAHEAGRFFGTLPVYEDPEAQAEQRQIEGSLGKAAYYGARSLPLMAGSAGMSLARAAGVPGTVASTAAPQTLWEALKRGAQEGATVGAAQGEDLRGRLQGAGIGAGVGGLFGAGGYGAGKISMPDVRGRLYKFVTGRDMPPPPTPREIPGVTSPQFNLMQGEPPGPAAPPMDEEGQGLLPIYPMPQTPQGGAAPPIPASAFKQQGEIPLHDAWANDYQGELDLRYPTTPPEAIRAVNKPRLRAPRAGPPTGGPRAQLYRPGEEPGTPPPSRVAGENLMDYANYPQQFLPGMSDWTRSLWARSTLLTPEEAGYQGYQGYLDPDLFEPQPRLPFERRSPERLYEDLYGTPPPAALPYNPYSTQDATAAIGRPETELERRMRLMSGGRRPPHWSDAPDEDELGRPIEPGAGSEASGEQEALEPLLGKDVYKRGGVNERMRVLPMRRNPKTGQMEQAPDRFTPGTWNPKTQQWVPIRPPKRLGLKTAGVEEDVPGVLRDPEEFERAKRIVDEEMKAAGRNPEEEAISRDPVPFKRTNKYGNQMSRREYYQERVENVIQQLRGRPLDTREKAYAPTTKIVKEAVKQQRAPSTAAEEKRAQMGFKPKPSGPPRPVVHGGAQWSQVAGQLPDKDTPPLPLSEAPKDGIKLTVPKEYEGHVFAASGTREKGQQFPLSVSKGWTNIAPKRSLDLKTGIIVRGPQTGRQIFIDSATLERNGGDVKKSVQEALLGLKQRRSGPVGGSK